MVAEKPKDKDYEVIEFVKERSVVVTRIENTRDVQSQTDLQVSSFVAYREQDPLLKIFLAEHFPRFAFSDLKIPIIVNSQQSLIKALLMTDTFGVLPIHSVESEISRGTLRIASSRDFIGRTQIVYRKGKRMRKAQHIFLQNLQQHSIFD